jgi:hypothetical protein
MQRLEVSGAVRPLKWTLGVKWLSISPLSRPTVAIVVLSTFPTFKSHSSLVLLSCLVVIVANLQSLQLSTGPPVAVLDHWTLC